ncbi:hypothetical protein [Pseudobutyrivibrio ruminis]|uniref:hypothetical protein n=1 Tax=Pseudobutyrivibrio ruminis TaxID=46206 RepID=UPI0004211EF9|nr:hypothetical protein [Pseudobutyrivibrio ruminis]
MAKYNIGGYIFDDENKAKKAAKELKSVEYILAQLKDADERGVLKVYKKLINQRLFSTEIGMGFLSQLRQNLVATGAFSEDEIPEIYSLETGENQAVSENKSEVLAQKEETEKIIDEKPKAKKEKADKKVVSNNEPTYGRIKRLKLINKILLVLCITLLLCVIGMFYVNSTINSPTILDYEEKIIDEYSSWEQQLSEREQQLNEREALIKEKELQQ